MAKDCSENFGRVIIIIVTLCVIYLAKKWTLPKGVLDVTKRIFSSKTHFPENHKS